VSLAEKLRARLRDGYPRCKTCSAHILLSRLEALPDTEYCAEHSREGAYVGVPNYAHKTAATVAMVKADLDAPDGMGESVRIMMNAYKRKR